MRNRGHNTREIRRIRALISENQDLLLDVWTTLQESQSEKIATMAKETNLHLEPVIHDTRNEPLRVSFTDTHAMIDLADGRIIGVPLSFFPLLEAASDEARQNYKLYSDSIYWENIDDGIDLTAMLSGLYLETPPEYMEYLKTLIAERKAKAVTT